MKDDIEVVEYKGFKIRIVQDEDPISPREHTNLGTIVCFHRKYTLGDTHSFSNPEELCEFLNDSTNEIVFRLPLYLYDHSGITISTSPFACKWDSGKVGEIYVSQSDIDQIYKGFDIKFDIDEIQTCLQAEVDQYDRYLRGEYVGYIVEDNCGRQVDSCWSFSDKSEAIEYAKSFINTTAKRIEYL